MLDSLSMWFSKILVIEYLDNSHSKQSGHNIELSSFTPDPIRLVCICLFIIFILSHFLGSSLFHYRFCLGREVLSLSDYLIIKFRSILPWNQAVSCYCSVFIRYFVMGSTSEINTRQINILDSAPDQWLFCKVKIFSIKSKLLDAEISLKGQLVISFHC